jgi:alkylation response protein AidB-like acyl-CoA dehydrogenase
VTARAGADATRRFADLELDRVHARRVGDPSPSPSEVAAALDRTLDRSIAALVTDGLGCAARALELAVAYGHDRHQFGRPIGSFQAVQHLCADMLREVELTRAGAYYALWACDATDEGRLGAGERRRAVALAKAQAARAVPWVTAQAIQVFGGIGFTWEHDAHLYHRRSLTVEHLLGDRDHHLDLLADVLIDGEGWGGAPRSLADSDRS